MANLNVAAKNYIIPGDQDTWVQGSNGAQRGPFSFKSIVTNPNFNPGTLIWTEQTGDWTPLGQTQLSENDITKTIELNLLKEEKPSLKVVYNNDEEVFKDEDLTPFPGALRPTAGSMFLKSIPVLVILAIGFGYFWNHVRSVDQQKDASIKLLQGAYNLNVKAEEAALKAGADVNFSANGWTALMYAAFRNDEASAKLLLKYHANIRWTNSKGQSALSVAQSKGNTGVVRILQETSKPGR